MPGSKLQDLLDRTASLEGEARERAFEELLRLLMILVRAKMDARLRNQRESVDVCQSVAKSFVEDWEAGKVKFASEAALAGYLQKVVRNKLADLSRRDTAARRGGGATPLPIDAERGVAEEALHDGAAGLSSVIADRELHANMLEGLTAEEVRLIDYRKRGLDWEQIAKETGESSVALRKRWSRLQAKLSDQLRGSSEAG